MVAILLARLLAFAPQLVLVYMLVVKVTVG